MIRGRDFVAIYWPVRFDEVLAEPRRCEQGLADCFPDAIERHTDPRGVFLYPDVAEPKSRSYERVIEEVGDTVGIWLRPTRPDGVASGDLPLGLPADARNISTEVTFDTTWPFDKVVDFYLEQLRAFGMPPQQEKGKEGWGVYVHLEGRLRGASANIYIESDQPTKTTVSLTAKGAVYVEFPQRQ